MGFLGDLGLSAFNGVTSVIGNAIANKQARDNLDYQMEKYYSPKAQVNNLAAAGVNPAVAFGNQSPVFSGGGQFQVPSNPLAGIGTTSLSDLANYINAKANATKSGAETRKTDLEADAISFENELNKIFKQPERVANLMSAYKSMQLQDDEHNINEWRKSKEKALSELTGVQRDTATKVFNNMDIQIRQENRQREESIKLTKERQKTERTSQTANNASAEASKATAKNQLSQAEVNKEDRRIQAALADFEESAKPYKIVSYVKELKAKNAISEADYNEAILKLYRLQDVIESRNTSEIYSGVDSFSEWLKGKVSIFGALK